MKKGRQASPSRVLAAACCRAYASYVTKVAKLMKIVTKKLDGMPPDLLKSPLLKN